MEFSTFTHDRIFYATNLIKIVHYLKLLIFKMVDVKPKFWMKKDVRRVRIQKRVNDLSILMVF